LRPTTATKRTTSLTSTWPAKRIGTLHAMLLAFA
jgi:hypothetical protein